MLSHSSHDHDGGHLREDRAEQNRPPGYLPAVPCREGVDPFGGQVAVRAGEVEVELDRCGHLAVRHQVARSSIGGNLSGDDQTLNVRGALIDLADPDVAVDPLDREVVEIAVAAVDLDGG